MYDSIMRALLTSAGFTNPKIVSAFQKLNSKPLSEMHLGLISIGIDTPELREREQMKIQELKQTGFGTVTSLDAATPLPPDALDHFDAVYMRGGNTFFILQAIRETGFDHLIVSFALRGGLYIGSSAGSIILGPDIAIAGHGSQADPNEIELKDTKGLNLMPFAVMPHFRPELQSETDAFAASVRYPVIPLSDDQAMLCIDRNYVRIG
jgi:peptidase E